MNDLIESGVESAVSGLLAALLSFVIANIGPVLLIAALLAGAWFIYSMLKKRKERNRSAERAAKLHREAESKLQSLLVSDMFKELELGLMQGETASRMQGMEQVAYTLLEQAKQLGNRLNGQQASPASGASSEHLADQLEMEADDLYHRVQLYLNDLAGMSAEVKDAAQYARQLEGQLTAIQDQLEQFERLEQQPAAQSDELHMQLQTVRNRLGHAGQLAAFDAVQSRSELRQIGMQLRQLQSRVKAIISERQ